MCEDPLYATECSRRFDIFIFGTALLDTAYLQVTRKLWHARRGAALLAVIALLADTPQVAWGWGAHGHTLAGQAATLKLPAEMPKFFLTAAEQLGYLTAEPDRWRDPSAAAVTNAFNPDHAINLELVPEGALQARDRFAYLTTLQNNGLTVAVGMAPFRTLELFQRLRTEFRLWRSAPDEKTRGWIQQRIINDAGILGHYVTDGSQPLHTSVSHHGWVGDNPSGFITDPSIHARFEGQYVDTHIQMDDVLPRMTSTPRVIADAQPAIVAYFQTTHTYLNRLYELEKQSPFSAETTASENKAFVAERLAAGATMLRDLWWTAWVESATATTRPPRAVPQTPQP